MEIASVQTQTVYSRNRMGQFISRCEAAARRTAERSAEMGERTAKSLAPVRSGVLKNSIHSWVEGTQGKWAVEAPHWPYVEFDTKPHMIYGKLYFPWKGGFFYWWNPAFPGNQDGNGAWVFHPGTRAQPFMVPSYEIVSKAMMRIAKEEYPG